jgi:hypothetical protein
MHIKNLQNPSYYGTVSLAAVSKTTRQLDTTQICHATNRNDCSATQHWCLSQFSSQAAMHWNAIEWPTRELIAVLSSNQPNH